MITLMMLLTMAGAEPPIAPGLLENGATLPAAPPKALLKYLGEYGSEAKKIYLAERGGKLTCLIDSTDLSDLEPTGRGRYRFPKTSRHAGEEIRMEPKGLRLGKVFYPRLPEPNRNFRVEMQKPLGELLKIAAASAPPTQPAGLLPPDLVDLRGLPVTLHLIYVMRQRTTSWHHRCIHRLAHLRSGRWRKRWSKRIAGWHSSATDS